MQTEREHGAKNPGPGGSDAKAMATTIEGNEESKLKRAKDLTQRYKIRSVPVIVVDGKYVVDGPQIKSYGDMLAVTDELVAKERFDR